jgi:phosphoglycolate phosphatase
MSTRFDAIIFDLDGTLADTLVDIANAANNALRQLGHAPIATDRYRYLAGQGIKWLMTHALGPEHDHQTDQGIELFLAYYAEHATDHTAPYPGVIDLLEELTARELKLGVLSNKPEMPVRRLAPQICGPYFDALYGARSTAPLKPDPTLALEMCEQFRVAPQRVLMLGDSENDIKTAVAAGMFPVGALWGFREEKELRDAGAQALIDHPIKLLELL